jgi:hypothetical protein
MYPSLQTGMIDCIAGVPLTFSRACSKAEPLVDVSWSYMMGATIVEGRVGGSADVRPKLLRIARDLGRRSTAGARLSADAVCHAEAGLQS